jgi:hypothetical protein
VRDVRKRPDFIRPARGIAAGDDDAGVRVVARDATDRLTRALVGGRGHRTTVDDHEVRSIRRRRNGAAGAQLFLDGERIGLVHATAEGDDGVLHHGVST